MLIYADSMTKHIGLFQIPFLKSCPLLIDQKISLISLARCTISGQSDSDTETDSTSRYSFFRIGFQINYRSSERYINFIHRQGTANYKVQG